MQNQWHQQWTTLMGAGTHHKQAVIPPTYKQTRVPALWRPTRAWYTCHKGFTIDSWQNKLFWYTGKCKEISHSLSQHILCLISWMDTGFNKTGSLLMTDSSRYVTSWSSTCQQASWVTSLKLACSSSDWWPMTEHQLCSSVCLRTAHSAAQTEVETLWCPGHYRT